MIRLPRSLLASVAFIAVAVAVAVAVAAVAGCASSGAEPTPSSEDALRTDATDAQLEAELKQTIDGIEMTSEGDFTFEVLKSAAPTSSRVSGRLLKETFNDAPRFRLDLQGRGPADMALRDMKGVRRFAFDEWFANEVRAEEDAEEDAATRLYRERMQKLHDLFAHHLTDRAVYLLAPKFDRGSLDVGLVHVLIAGRASSGRIFVVATAVVWT